MDDPELLEVARNDAKRQPEVFGNVYQVFGDVPALGASENLFITAHGAYKGDEGNPVIGDQSQDFYVDALTLVENMTTVFPGDYRGNVYISACESADHGRADFSFAEVFNARIHGARPSTGKVYGQKGSVGLRIPPPDDSGWVQAT